MQFLGFFIKFEKILNLLASAIGDFLIYANGQILKNNLATWSHGWHVMIFNNLVGHDIRRRTFSLNFFALGAVLTLYLTSSLNPSNLVMTVSASPFNITIGTKIYGTSMTSTPSAVNPFDLLVTCGGDNFKVLVNGEQGPIL